MHCNGSCKKFKATNNSAEYGRYEQGQNDALHVRYSLIGKGCGVLVVGVY